MFSFGSQRAVLGEGWAGLSGSEVRESRGLKRGRERGIFSNCCGLTGPSLIIAARRERERERHTFSTRNLEEHMHVSNRIYIFSSQINFTSFSVYLYIYIYIYVGQRNCEHANLARIVKSYNKKKTCSNTKNTKTNEQTNEQFNK